QLVRAGTNDSHWLQNLHFAEGQGNRLRVTKNTGVEADDTDSAAAIIDQIDRFTQSEVTLGIISVELIVRAVDDKRYGNIECSNCACWYRMGPIRVRYLSCHHVDGVLAVVNAQPTIDRRVKHIGRSYVLTTTRELRACW